MPQGRKIIHEGMIKESSDLIQDREKAREGHTKFPQQPDQKKRSVEQDKKEEKEQ